MLQLNEDDKVTAHHCVLRLDPDVSWEYLSALRGCLCCQVAVGLVTKWEVERPIIAKKVVEKEAGFGFGDAWAAFLAGDGS